MELGSPTVLVKYGWTQNLLKIGDRVTANGWLARDGRKMISAMNLKLPGGTELFGASALFDTPFRAAKGTAGICISDEVCAGHGSRPTHSALAPCMDF